LRNVLQPAAEKAGLGRVKWHQFRYIRLKLGPPRLGMIEHQQHGADFEWSPSSG
jgi:hypothetical protein